MTEPAVADLRVYNTLTRSVDRFTPLRPKRVNMFVCGPTVWDKSHVGHAKTYVAYDIMARYLRKRGFSVFFILNITDIDDKIINRAKETGEDPLKLADRYAQAFFKDMKDLRVESVNLYAKASDHTPEIIGQIQSLIYKGMAYRIDDDVYFDISKFPGYGKLSKQKLEDLTVHRVDPDPRKRNPGDFVLWKSHKPGEISWDSPWGKGRPGWHIEDTAITLTYFGPTYDIHGGGSDLIFPHHEAEIAQAEGLTGKSPLAKYWLHTGLLNVRGQGMHKSLRNTIPIQSALKNVGSDALRVLYASTHYRSPLEFNEEVLQQAASLAQRFKRTYDSLLVQSADVSHAESAIETLRKIERLRDEFFKAMDDDFNTPAALTALIGIVGIAEDSKMLGKKLVHVLMENLRELGSVLGVLEAESVSQERFSELVSIILDLRRELRSKGDYTLADRIRDRMARLGIVVEDTAQETKWIP